MTGDERVKKLDGIQVDVKDYGNVMLAHKYGREVPGELLRFFSVSDSEKIYAYALLKVLYGDIPSRDMELHYDTSFVSELYPNVGCSRKTVSNYIDLLGRNLNPIVIVIPYHAAPPLSDRPFSRLVHSAAGPPFL